MRLKNKLKSQLQRAEKVEVIGTLAGGVAHDLNNIPGGFVKYPELLLLQLPEDSALKKSIPTHTKVRRKGSGGCSGSTDETILIVDDVKEQREVASGMLKELGYSIVTVSSGEEAFKYLAPNKVDLMLLDRKDRYCG